MENQQLHKERADRLALPMFALSVFFVMLLAALIVVWVDIPRVAELSALDQYNQHPAASAVARLADAQTRLAVQSTPLVQRTDSIGKIFQLTLLVIWPLFWLEYLSAFWHSDQRQPFSGGGVSRLLVCLIPPLRLATPSSAWGGRIWLPVLYWQPPGKILSRSLEREFSKPMLIIALLILPILLVEYGLHSVVEENAWLRMALHASTGFIWCAFAIEFVIMVSATDRKLAYIKKHWIDLAIILLPLISFLRSVRVLRLAKLAKVQKLSKMGRVFRMRGLLMKTLRALMLFEVINRLLRVTPEKKLAKLKATYKDRLEDLEELKSEIDELEQEACAPAC